MKELPFEKIEEKQKQFIVHYPPDVKFDVSRKSFHYADEMTSAIDRIARKMAEDADMYIICEMAKRWLEDQKPHKWIIGKGGVKYGGQCGKCGLDMPSFMNDWKNEFSATKFCPHCGSRMKGTETKEGDEK